MVAAMILGDRPVKWIEDRAENLISGGHAREESLEITAATDEHGLLLAARAHHVENVGAYPGVANGQMAGSGVGHLPRALPLVGARVRWPTPAQAVYTNTCGLCAYRGPWMMETTGREQMVDVIAQQAGHRPAGVPPPQRDLPLRAALHQRHVDPVRGVSPAGVPGAGGRADRLRAVPQGPGSGPRRGPPGRHRAVPVHRAAARRRCPGGSDAATIRIEPSGKVNVYMGTGSHGQSIETTMTQIVADEMGVNVAGRALHPGRHGLHAVRDATGGSRTAGVAGGAAHEAGAAMRERVLARGRADARDRPGRPGDGRQRGPRQGRPGQQGRLAGRDRRRGLPAQPRRAAARRRAGPGTDPAVPGTGLDVLQRLPRGHGRDRPGDRHGGHPALRDLRGLRRDDQPERGGGTDRRRRGAGHRRGVLRAHALRRRREPDHHHVHGLPAAHRGRSPGPGIRPRDHPGADPRAATRASAKAARSPPRPR